MKQNSKEKGEITLFYAEMHIEKYPLFELSMQFLALIVVEGYNSE